MSQLRPRSTLTATAARRWPRAPKTSAHACEGEAASLGAARFAVGAGGPDSPGPRRGGPGRPSRSHGATTASVRARRDPVRNGRRNQQGSRRRLDSGEPQVRQLQPLEIRTVIAHLSAVGIFGLLNGRSLAFGSAERETLAVGWFRSTRPAIGLDFSLAPKALIGRPASYSVPTC